MDGTNKVDSTPRINKRAQFETDHENIKIRKDISSFANESLDEITPMATASIPGRTEARDQYKGQFGLETNDADKGAESEIDDKGAHQDNAITPILGEDEKDKRIKELEKELSVVGAQKNQNFLGIVRRQAAEIEMLREALRSSDGREKKWKERFLFYSKGWAKDEDDYGKEIERARNMIHLFMAEIEMVRAIQWGHESWEESGKKRGRVDEEWEGEDERPRGKTRLDRASLMSRNISDI